MDSNRIRLTKNFLLDEFTCHNSVWVPEEYMKNVKELAENLQVLRDFINVSVHINSGYRTEGYNKEIGGSKNSQHILAKAADITTESSYIDPDCLYVIIRSLVRAGKMEQGGLGLYKTFVHYDIRGIKARW